jgi:OOP family OmpA-OmpF porin
MTPMLTRTVAVLAVLAAAGCTSSALEEARSANRQGSAFDQALSQNYLALAQAEDKQNDPRDTYTYAKRSVHTAQGKPLMPDDFTNRSLGSSEKNELSQARQELLAALDANGRTTAPQDAARAQVYFDCWVEQAEEDVQPDHVAACRDAFYASLERVKAARAPAQAPAAVVASPDRYLVFFDFDESELTSTAKEVIAEAAKTAKETGAAQIMATGYTDRAGPPQYNQKLSERRAASVREELLAQGIQASEIETVGRGENNPLVETGDGVREARNRRVEIMLK